MCRQERFRKEFKIHMRREFETFTNTSTVIGFPETLADSTGVSDVDAFNVLTYMEARFALFECIDVAQKLLLRKIRLDDIDFMLQYGRLPIVRRSRCPQEQMNREQTTQEEEDATSRVGTRAAKVGRLLQKMAPLVRLILNDHPHRLNLYSYYLIASVFRGPTLERLVKQECALLSLILESFTCARGQKSPPSILTWMGLTAQKLLKSQVTVTEQLQLIAITQSMGIVNESWAQDCWKSDAQTFQVYFSTCPELLKAKGLTDELTLHNGMITITGANVLSLVKEQLYQIMIILSKLLQDGKVSLETTISRALSTSLKFTQRRIFKVIASTKDQHEIASVRQLQREKPLLPPCIYMLLEKLQNNNVLSNVDRTYLIIYLMNIGLPLRETEHLLRSHYSQNANLEDQWSAQRGGHLRRKYRNEKQHQYGCHKFDRYCVWRRGAITRQTLAKIRRGQQNLSAEYCSPDVFNGLLNSINSARDSDGARALCSRLGCFEDSGVKFYSPLGYYYNTKGRLNRTNRLSENEEDFSW